MSPPGLAGKPGWKPDKRGSALRGLLEEALPTESAQPVSLNQGPGEDYRRTAQNTELGACWQEVCPTQRVFLLRLHLASAAHSLPLGPGLLQRGWQEGTRAPGGICAMPCAQEGSGRREGRNRHRSRRETYRQLHKALLGRQAHMGANTSQQEPGTRHRCWPRKGMNLGDPPLPTSHVIHALLEQWVGAPWRAEGL